MHESPAPQACALWPLLLFLVLFIGTGIVLTVGSVDMAFYQLSATVAILPAIVWAVMQNRKGATKLSLNQKISLFLQGVGEINIITMCMIYLLAGAFAAVASSIGGVSATVNFGLSLVPPSLVLPGLFVIAAFVSTAMGTSMGTIAAIAPIAIGVASQTDISLNLLLGTVLGGAMFGDNLSMISDTTIAATRTQGCEMKDKFLMNFRIVLPAALIVLALLYFISGSEQSVKVENYEFIKVLPYLAILGMALAGINVFVVLLSGVAFTGLVGLIVVPDYTFLKLSQDIYAGFTGMNEIMVLSMMLGGLGELIRYNGGISWLLATIDRLSANWVKDNPSKAGEWSIALLVSVANLCVANNTVAIILTGGMAKEIATKNHIDPRRSASILDIFSCACQGLIPYGAQLLLAGSLSKVSPLVIATQNWYGILLFFAGVLAIGLARRKF